MMSKCEGDAIDTVRVVVMGRVDVECFIDYFLDGRDGSSTWSLRTSDWLSPALGIKPDRSFIYTAFLSLSLCILILLHCVYSYCSYRSI